MNIYRVNTDDPQPQFRIEAESNEYDTLYYALKEYGKNLKDSVANRILDGTEAEEYMFLGEQLNKVGKLMFAMEEHNLGHDDKRWT